MDSMVLTHKNRKKTFICEQNEQNEQNFLKFSENFREQIIFLTFKGGGRTFAESLFETDYNNAT